MKTILNLVVCAAALLPLAQLQAAPNFHGLTPGTKFSQKVVSVESYKTTFTSVKKCPIPTDMPTFAKGQKVKLSIASKGELQGPGFLIPLQKASSLASAYTDKTSSSKKKWAVGLVAKRDGKPQYTELGFMKVKNPNRIDQAVYSVVYTLK